MTVVGDAPGASPRWRRLESRLDAMAVRATEAARRVRDAVRRTPVFLAVLFASTAAWILLWAGYDLALLTRAFPSAPGYHPNMDIYLEATWWVIFPISTFLIFRRHAWLPILALAVGGWEDILFYWVQRGWIPAALAYLPQTPTAGLLYLRAVLFLVAALAGAIVARDPRTRIRFVPLEVVMLLTAIFGSFWVFVASIPVYAMVRPLARHFAPPVASG